MSEKKYSVLPGTEGYGLESVEALVALGVPAKVGRIVSRCLNDDWDGDNEDSGSQMVRGNVSDVALVPTEMVDQLIAGWLPTQTPPKDRFGYITWNPNPAFLRTPYGPRRAAIKPQSWPSRRKGNMKTEMAFQCSFTRTFSSCISLSFSSSNRMILYINGTDAVTVKNTITNEA